MLDKDTSIEEKSLPLSDEMKAKGATLIKPRKIMEVPNVDLDGLFHKLRLVCRQRRTISAKKLAKEIVAVSKCTTEMLARFIFDRPRKASYDAVAKIFGDEIRDCALCNMGPSFPTLIHIAVASRHDNAFGQKPDWWWENTLKKRYEALPETATVCFKTEVRKKYRIRFAQLEIASKAFAAYAASHLP